MEKRASIRFRVIIFILTAAAIGFVFSRSVMTADESSMESAGMLEFMSGLLKAVGIRAELTDHIIRKLAHFTEFTVVGMLLTGCAYSFDRLRPHRCWATVLFAGLSTAVADETIQLFSDGRSGQITDVLLDFSGVLTGTALMLAIFAIYRQIKKRKNQHE